MIHFFYDSYLMVLQFLIPGIFLGLIYDIFRIIRIMRNDSTQRLSEMIRKRFFSQEKEQPKKKIKNSQKRENILIFIEDIFFFLIVAVTEILAVYYFNDGEIRIYCLLFSAIGFICYQKTVGRLVISLSKKIVYFIRKIVYCFVCLILKPWFAVSKKLNKRSK